MADKTIIGSLLFAGSFEKKVEDLGLTTEEIKDGNSTYSPSRVKVGKISPLLTKVLTHITDGEVAIGKTSRGETVIEMPTGTPGKYDIVIRGKDGSLKASTYDKDTHSLSNYEVGRGKRKGSALFASLIPEAIKDAEAKECYDYLIDNLNYSTVDDILDLEFFKKTLAIFSQNLYYRIIDGSLGFNLPETKRLNPVKMDAITSGIYTPETTLMGTFQVLTVEKAKLTSHKESLLAKDMDEYKNPYSYTAEEQMMIPPKRPVDYRYAPQTIQGIKYILETTKFGNMAYRNFLFIGCPGSGKTTAAEDIASYLRCPKLTFSCNANTTGPDFAGYVIPSSQDTDVPTLSVEDMLFDPEGSYKELTGEEPPIGLTEAEVINLYLDKKKGSDTGVQYNVVYSPICQAQLIEGWVVVEIQEVANIVQPGAISALNSILEPIGSITAPDGKLLKRNLNCIFVLTMNDTTKASRGLDEAILSRMQYVPEFDTPTQEELRDRAMYLTKCKDVDMVTEMVRITSEINQYLIDNELSDGSCGARELYNWIISAMILDNPIKAFEDTILQKATSDKEERAVIRSTFLESSSFFEE